MFFSGSFFPLATDSSMDVHRFRFGSPLRPSVSPDPLVYVDTRSFLPDIAGNPLRSACALSSSGLWMSRARSNEQVVDVGFGRVRGELKSRRGRQGLAVGGFGAATDDVGASCSRALTKVGL